MKTNFFPCFLKRFRKTLSLFLAIAFLSSNIVYASADTPIFNLATPTNITSDQFQDIARVEIGLRQALKSAGIAGFEDIKSLDRLRSIWAKDVVVKNVFGLRITGAVHFEDARAVEVEARPGYIVIVNIKGFDYACLVRAGADGYKYETSVVPYSLFVRERRPRTKDHR